MVWTQGYSSNLSQYPAWPRPRPFRRRARRRGRRVLYVHKDEVTTPCAEMARRVADQSRSRTAEQCLRAQRGGATRERVMRAATMREPLHASAVASPQAGPLLRAAARRLRCCPPCQASRLGCVGTLSIHPVLATTRLMKDIEIGSSEG